jgi:hypothetical protein
MADEADFGLWEGQHGGIVDGPYVGAHVIDANTDLRGQVEEVLDGGWLQVRLDDGRSVRMKVRRPNPDELRKLRGG